MASCYSSNTNCCCDSGVSQSAFLTFKSAVCAKLTTLQDTITECCENQEAPSGTVEDTYNLLGGVPGATVTVQAMIDAIVVLLHSHIESSSDLLAIGDQTATLTIPTGAVGTPVIDILRVDPLAAEMAIADYEIAGVTLTVYLGGTEDVDGGHRVYARWPKMTV